MKQRWFKSFGWLYIPIHPAGFLISLLAILFMIPIVIVTIRNGHSVSDDLYTLFVYSTCIFFWWKWIAEKNL